MGTIHPKELIDGLEKKFEEESSDIKKLSLLNITHKRDFLGNISTLTTAEIAGLLTLKTSGIDLNPNWWLLTFLVLVGALVFNQVYRFILLLLEGQGIDYLSKQIPKLHTGFYAEMKELSEKGRTLEEIMQTMHDKTPGLYAKYLKKNNFLSKIQTVIASDYTFTVIILLYLLGTFTIICSIKIIPEFIISFFH